MPELQYQRGVLGFEKGFGSLEFGNDCGIAVGPEAAHGIMAFGDVMMHRSV